MSQRKIRGKQKDQKYVEAVERNIHGMKKERMDKYKGLALDVAKRKLGIRESDTSHDAELKKILGD